MGPLDVLRRLGAGLSRLTERWVPDAWVICMLMTLLAFALAISGADASIEQAVLAWGAGVWDLLGLAMQFTIIFVAAHACVASRPAHRWLDRIAALPDPLRPVQAVLLVGGFSLLTGYINGALCLVAGALLVPFVARRNPHADIRILICAAYLGLGTVWHGGLAGSAPLIMAGIAVVERLYPVDETLFHPFNLAYLVLIGAVGLLAVTLLHPREGAQTLSAEQVADILPSPPPTDPPATTPAQRMDQSRLWVWLAVGLLTYPVGHAIVERGFGSAWGINAYNATFLALALILHGRPVSFLRACRAGVDTAWGIIVQYPFYAGIFGLMQHTSLGDRLSELFAGLTTAATFPWVVYAYSGLMNLFVPSAGSKWLIEAPYLIPAGEALGVPVIATLFAYAYGDSTTNLIQPFWALPILAVARLKFGEVVGYCFLVALACFLVSSAVMFWMPALL
jgi:short-chain fatty acids transporter